MIECVHGIPFILNCVNCANSRDPYDVDVTKRPKGTSREAFERDRARAAQLDAQQEIKRLRKVLKRAKRLMDYALPKFNWGASALDARAIALLNEVPVEVDKALKGLR